MSGQRFYSEEGFTIVETLVTVLVLSVVSIGLYSVLFGTTRSAETSQNVVRVSEEARLGLNRMIRDTREGQLFSDLEAERFNVRIDFDGDGTYENPNENGDYENLTYRYNEADETITLNDQLLIDGVEPVGTGDVFTYSSNDLRYDFDRDGVTERDDFVAAAGEGYAVDPDDSSLYSNVEFRFTIRVGNRSMAFHGQAQLRNRR
jgi:type II secretory pathway pseudopilin PulG